MDTGPGFESHHRGLVPTPLPSVHEGFVEKVIDITYMANLVCARAPVEAHSHVHITAA